MTINNPLFHKLFFYFREVEANWLLVCLCKHVKTFINETLLQILLLFGIPKPPCLQAPIVRLMDIVRQASLCLCGETHLSLYIILFIYLNIYVDSIKLYL